MRTSILVIDDDREFLISLSKTLQKHGYGVACSSDPSAAVRYVQTVKEQFDLIITDYLMPGLRGLEVIEQLKRLFPNIPILLVTAYGTDQTLTTAKKLGAIACLSKPIETKQLIAIIKKTTGTRMMHHEMENNV